jgi:1-deoxy-D-xylulose 5-phosphate reductoisomerase
MPAVLNAANEQAVALFLEEKIQFLDIPKLIEKPATNIKPITVKALV